MKKIFALTLLLSLVSSPAWALKVGKIDAQKIMTSIKQGKKINANLKKEFESKQKLLKKDEEKLKKMRADFDKQSMVMNDKAKIKKQTAMQKLYGEYMQKREMYQQEINKKERKLKAPLLERLKGIVDQVAKKESVDMVFEVAASPVYVKTVVDLSDKVIKAYDKKYK